MRSGFVALLGRPNAGKSTLLNQIVGSDVSIVSSRPQTTRRRILGVAHRRDAQIVFVDTPGLHKPVTALGERLNDAARAAVRDLEELDVACLVVNASAPLGAGDKQVWESLPPASVFVLTQCDKVSRETIAQQLAAAAPLDAAAYFAVSGLTGDGVSDFVGYLDGRMGDGPAYFPDTQVTDLPEHARVAEVVRQELIERLRDELPYSVATRVTSWEPSHVACEIIVERESQKGIVIGHKGKMLAEVGKAARQALGYTDTYLALTVRVLPDWQHHADAVSSLIESPTPNDL